MPIESSSLFTSGAVTRRASVRRSFAWTLSCALLTASSFLAADSLRANTELDVASGLASGSDLSVGTSYTGGLAPTATSDVTFQVGNTYTSPYLFNSGITIGSFNDLSATPLTINGGAGTVTLAGGDSVSGNTSDLLYVGTGANLTYSQNLVIGATGNINVAGTATIGYIADGSNGNSNAPTGISSGLIKTGAGTLVLTANNTYTGGTTVSGGTLQMNFGGQGYGGLRGTATVNTGGTLALNAGDALGYNAITAGNSLAQLTINGGTVNIMVNANEGYTANLTMTGGTFSSTGGGAFNINPGAANAPGITTNASAMTALISANVVQRSGTPLLITTASGTTPSGSDLTVSGVISGGGITKAGTGTMLLTATNTYTGATTVNAGAILLSGTGSTSSGSAVTVNSTGTVGGTGTIGGAVTINSGGILTAGSRTLATPTGALATGALTLNAGATFNAVLTSASAFSTLNALNTTPLAGAFSISLTPGATFANGVVLQLITSFVSGSFTDATYTTGGYKFTADYTTDPGFFDVDVTPAPVPEPSTWLCLLTTAGIFGFVSRRRRGVKIG